MQDANEQTEIFCPRCHCYRFNKHGCYMRKGFHSPENGAVSEVRVQRYRCLNRDCPLCTFSVLPPMILRYCRFFWPHLLSIKLALDSGSTRYYLACHEWHVSWAIIGRAAALLNRMESWVKGLHQEITDGRPARRFELMVKIITVKLGALELNWRWYRHRYPRRFPDKLGQHTI